MLPATAEELPKNKHSVRLSATRLDFSSTINTSSESVDSKGRSVQESAHPCKNTGLLTCFKVFALF